MNGMSKLRALGLALGMVGAAAGTGWALQLPLTAMVANVGPINVPPVAALAGAPAWPHLAAQADEGATASRRFAGPQEVVEELAGLEAMSATGAAAVQW